MKAVEDFLRNVDAAWRWPSPTKVRLRIIGSAALLLQTDYQRGTKDSDVLETSFLTPETQKRLIELAGRDTTLHTRHRLYIDIVASGIPFLPHPPLCHELTSLNLSLRNFELELLDIVDVVVSKLKRFNANDRSDVAAMIERNLAPHERLVERFLSAVDIYSIDARAEELPRYISNLHRVERDDYDVPETPIELPDWIDC